MNQCYHIIKNAIFIIFCQTTISTALQSGFVYIEDYYQFPLAFALDTCHNDWSNYPSYSFEFYCNNTVIYQKLYLSPNCYAHWKTIVYHDYHTGSCQHTKQYNTVDFTINECHSQPPPFLDISKTAYKKRHNNNTNIIINNNNNTNYVDGTNLLQSTDFDGTFVVDMCFNGPHYSTMLTCTDNSLVWHYYHDVHCISQAPRPQSPFGISTTCSPHASYSVIIHECLLFTDNPTTAPIRSPTISPTTKPTISPTITPAPEYCITSCKGRKDGNYHSCTSCNYFARCSGGYLYDNRACGSAWGHPLEYDAILDACVYRGQSQTCRRRAYHAKTVVNEFDLADSSVRQTKKNSPIFEYIIVIGMILFVLVNSIFVGLWCFYKRNNKNHGHYKDDMINVSDNESNAINA